MASRVSHFGGRVGTRFGNEYTDVDYKVFFISGNKLLVECKLEMS